MKGHVWATNSYKFYETLIPPDMMIPWCCRDLAGDWPIPPPPHILYFTHGEQFTGELPDEPAGFPYAMDKEGYYKAVKIGLAAAEAMWLSEELEPMPDTEEEIITIKNPFYPLGTIESRQTPLMESQEVQDAIHKAFVAATMVASTFQQTTSIEDETTMPLEKATDTSIEGDTAMSLDDETGEKGEKRAREDSDDTIDLQSIGTDSVVRDKGKRRALDDGE